jgi:hypothetical protein
MILLFISSYFNLITKSLRVNAHLFAMRSGKPKCLIKIEVPGLIIFIKREKNILNKISFVTVRKPVQWNHVYIRKEG